MTDSEFHFKKSLLSGYSTQYIYISYNKLLLLKNYTYYDIIYIQLMEGMSTMWGFITINYF